MTRDTERDSGLGADAGLELSRRVLDRLEAEREALERLLLRLPVLLAEPDPDAVARGAVEAAWELVGADVGFFVTPDRLADPPELVGLGRHEFSWLPSVAAAPLLAGVLWYEQAVRVDDVTVWAPSEEAARPYGVLADGRLMRSWLALPVRGRGGLVGAMYLGEHRAGAFSGRQERLVAALCAQLGLAIESTTLLVERSQVAAALQESLLPPLLPEVPGVDLAARYRPTGAGNLVGGDFYDVFPSGDGSWAVVVGDVSGFGAEAAALTGMARYTVRALAAEALPPSAVLTRLNDVMLEQRSDERFCTAVYAVLTDVPEGLHVRLASAGHPSALVLRDDETVEVVHSSGGALLGVLQGVEPGDHDLVLAAGDSLVLYTDGVIEARDPDGCQFGEHGLRRLLATSAGRSAGGIARRIELAVLDHHRGRHHDDLAIVVARVRP